MAAKVDSDADKTNTIDPDRLKKEVARIEEALEAKLSHRMRYVESCKPINERVANAYEIASKAAGVPMKVLKATIKQRELQRKIEGIPEKFEDETRETFDMVCQALGDFGDTPLGGAAKDRAAKAEGKKAEAPAGEPKKPRGRPRKAPSPEAAPAAPAAAPASAEPASNGEEPDDKDLRPPHLQRSEADREKDLADARAAEENAARLKAGISPLH